MKAALFFLLMTYLSTRAALQAESLNDKLSTDSLDTLSQSVTFKPEEITPEQQKVQKLTDAPPKPVDGITVKVMDMNVSKKSSVSVEYAPPIKQGEMIDNKQQTSVNYNLKF